MTRLIPTPAHFAAKFWREYHVATRSDDLADLVAHVRALDLPPAFAREFFYAALAAQPKGACN